MREGYNNNNNNNNIREGVERRGKKIETGRMNPGASGQAHEREKTAEWRQRGNDGRLDSRDFIRARSLNENK